MHTKGKSIDDATQLFMKECGSPEPEARREALRGTRDPGYINYTVGKLEILKLRDDYLAKMGDKFSLIDFHDRLLAGAWRQSRSSVARWWAQTARFSDGGMDKIEAAQRAVDMPLRLDNANALPTYPQQKQQQAA